MPATRVFFFQDKNADVPCREWLQQLYRSDKKAVAKMTTRMACLAQWGHDALDKMAAVLTRGSCDAMATDWSQVRYPHSAV